MSQPVAGTIALLVYLGALAWALFWKWDSMECRETTVRVAGAERVVRTELGGRIRTTKQLETAHTRAVKAALIEMRAANLPAYREALAAEEQRSWYPHQDYALKRLRRIVVDAEKGRLYPLTRP
jgi:hypothetical protein